MPKFSVIMKWNAAKEQYHMVNKKTQDFINEFFDCRFIKWAFKGLNKAGQHEYELTITKKGEAMSESNYYVKVELTVIGPKEGPVKTELEYQSTTKEMAVGIQNDLSQYFNSKNQSK